MNEKTKTCLSIACPERKSVCCGAISRLCYSKSGGSDFVCSKCGKDYVGGECRGAYLRKEVFQLERDFYEVLPIICSNLTNDSKVRKIKEVFIGVLKAIVTRIEEKPHPNAQDSYDLGYNDGLESANFTVEELIAKLQISDNE